MNALCVKCLQRIEAIAGENGVGVLHDRLSVNKGSELKSLAVPGLETKMPSAIGVIVVKGREQVRTLVRAMGGKPKHLFVTVFGIASAASRRTIGFVGGIGVYPP